MPLIHDSFVGSAGTLVGRVAPSGQTWLTAGGNDLALDGAGHLVASGGTGETVNLIQDPSLDPKALLLGIDWHIGSGTSAECSFLIRSVDVNNYVLFIHDSYAGEAVHTYIRSGGGYTHIATGGSGIWVPGETHRILLYIGGEEFYIFKDDLDGEVAKGRFANGQLDAWKTNLKLGLRVNKSAPGSTYGDSGTSTYTNFSAEPWT